MARVTIEDCLEQVENRFVLVHLASERARQLRKGARPFSERNNKEVVLSLREIAKGHITTANVKDFEPLPMEEERDEPIELIDDFGSGDD
ncbi:MAG: DNA-directed RNA polymerase subunit omega [Deltaproteobacteria bacterium]|jgi:DNA-directed RNA polymerase subunit omega|nr:DNA-directed RNA polymerase subunit omega [Deltaproteobacteria bacterium]